jgi:hypothetical protein
MAVDETGHDEPVGRKGASIEIPRSIADVAKCTARDNLPVAHHEGIIFAQLA